MAFSQRMSILGVGLAVAIICIGYSFNFSYIKENSFSLLESENSANLAAQASQVICFGKSVNACAKPLCFVAGAKTY